MTKLQIQKINKPAAIKIKVALICFFCCMALIFSGCTKTATSSNKDIQSTLDMLSQKVIEQTPEASIGSVNGDWAVLGLASGKADVPENYFNIYYDNIRAYVKSQKGMLSEDTYTEYARVSLALLAIGKDPQNVEGYDLIAPLDDYDKVIFQGINGPAYALIASNAAGIKLKSEEKYVEYTIAHELEQGGFAFDKNPDPGVTAMVLQGLAPYKDRDDVKKVIDRNLAVLSNFQKKDGTYDGGSETTSQVILALCALDIDPLTDEQFTKNNKTLLDVLLEYEKDGGLTHEIGEDANPMATEQGLYALSQVSAQ